MIIDTLLWYIMYTYLYINYVELLLALKQKTNMTD
jgi:hypothetical protein